jgi:hypothetical protein
VLLQLIGSLEVRQEKLRWLVLASHRIGDLERVEVQRGYLILRDFKVVFVFALRF